MSVAGRDEAELARAAERFGFERWTTDWRELVADPEVDVFENLGPNSLHAEPSIAAAEAGKHVLCEKPLARDAAEARAMLERSRPPASCTCAASTTASCRRVRRARELLEAGELGDIHHFRAHYRQSWGADPRSAACGASTSGAGGGALGDLASHVLDLGRYLVGDIASVAAETATFVPGREVDDAVAAARALRRRRARRPSRRRASPPAS